MSCLINGSTKSVYAVCLLFTINVIPKGDKHGRAVCDDPHIRLSERPMQLRMGLLDFVGSLLLEILFFRFFFRTSDFGVFVIPRACFLGGVNISGHHLILLFFNSNSIVPLTSFKYVKVTGLYDYV